VPTVPEPAVVLHRVALRRPALAIHGGAGRRPGGDDLEEAEVEGMRAALAAGWAVLDAGGPALDAAVAAVASMEASGVFNAGRGAVPTTAGTVETDAAVMGVAGEDAVEVSGAGCAMTWPEHPVHLARAVALAGETLLLAGPGADAFAERAGLSRRDRALLTGGGAAPVSDMGTVGAVALDAGGRLAAATSTGGRRGQPPGRVGDAPVIGAGTWARQGRVAVSATGDGEAFVRCGFAHLLDLRMGAGAGVEEAATEALVETARWGGTGGAVVLAADGTLVALHDTAAMARGWRHADGEVAEVAGG
jgi:beta-aspartyl-peptidase (threonine type)